MGTYLLTWSPLTWRWDAYDDDVARSTRGDAVEMEWATGNTKRIVPGDRVFLLRQGRDRPGIVASGTVLREVRAGPHFVPERRSRGERALFAVVRFDRVVG